MKHLTTPRCLPQAMEGSRSRSHTPETHMPMCLGGRGHQGRHGNSICERLSSDRFDDLFKHIVDFYIWISATIYRIYTYLEFFGGWNSFIETCVFDSGTWSSVTSRNHWTQPLMLSRKSEVWSLFDEERMCVYGTSFSPKVVPHPPTVGGC